MIVVHSQQCIVQWATIYAPFVLFSLILLIMQLQRWMSLYVHDVVKSGWFVVLFEFFEFHKLSQCSYGYITADNRTQNCYVEYQYEPHIYTFNT